MIQTRYGLVVTKITGHAGKDGDETIDIEYLDQDTGDTGTYEGYSVYGLVADMGWGEIQDAIKAFDAAQQ